MGFIESFTSYKEPVETRIENWINNLITIIELTTVLTFGALILWALFYGVVSFLLLLTTLLK